MSTGQTFGLNSLEGTYQPQPVKRVEIPEAGRRDQKARRASRRRQTDSAGYAAKFSKSGGTRRFPSTVTAFDRGAPPIRQWLRRNVTSPTATMSWSISISKSFFDRVNHDSLMARVAAQVSDKRVLKLIRAFLDAGVMEDGLVSPVDRWTPQGGPLSPILSNLVLDDLERKELARRGHRFCRYADDCNIYVRSRRAGERVMGGLRELVLDQQAAAQGQRGEERGGAAGGAKVSRVQHLE